MNKVRYAVVGACWIVQSSAKPRRTLTSYGRFCVALGHQPGFNDLKAIKVVGYLDAIVRCWRRPKSRRRESAGSL